MKRVLLRDRPPFRAREIVVTMIENPAPGAGLTYAEMKKRDRLLAALERHESDAYVDLEDADYAVLRALLDQFQFTTGKRGLRAILDDIANAKSPEETPALKLVEDDGG